MKIAFYAPMKPPDHPVPSGDRRMARLLMEAFERAGHEPQLACRFVSRDSKGDPARQKQLIEEGAKLADALLADYRALPPEARPKVWFTYHLYYKAPDLIGPQVAEGLGIPYIAAEASLAGKRAGGPWDSYHKALLQALKGARALVTINPADAPALPGGTKQLSLPPFLNARHDAQPKDRARAEVAGRTALPGDIPWLLAVGMFRVGDKLESYRLLGEALARLKGRDWRLLVVGDGPARAEVEAALAPLGEGRVTYFGQLDSETLRRCYAAADLLVWPARREAYGMALLEAQAEGLPVVAGREGGVGAVVADGESGLLSEPGDAAAFARALDSLLADPERRAAMGRAARERIARDHGLDGAAVKLDALLREVTA